MSVTCDGCNGRPSVPPFQGGGRGSRRAVPRNSGECPGDRLGCVVSYLPFLEVSQ